MSGRIGKVAFPTSLLALALALPLILKEPYQRGLLVLAIIYAVGGLSLDYIIGQMGQFSFGHAAFWGFGAYVSAKLALNFGVTPLIGFVAAAVLTALLGVIVGYVALSRTRGLDLAVVTLGFGVLAWLIALRLRSVTGGPAGLLGIPAPSIFGYEIREELDYYYLGLGILLLVILILSRLRRSRFGRAVRSIHENEPLAASVGISPTRYYTLAFGLATGLAGISGAMYAHYLRFVTPNLLGLTPMLTFLIIVILGGTGTLWGPVVGAGVFIWVSEFLRVSDELRFLIFGFVLFFIILFMPRGIYPTAVSVWSRLASLARVLKLRQPQGPPSDVVHEVTSSEDGKAPAPSRRS